MQISRLLFDLPYIPSSNFKINGIPTIFWCVDQSTRINLYKSYPCFVYRANKDYSLSKPFLSTPESLEEHSVGYAPHETFKSNLLVCYFTEQRIHINTNAEVNFLKGYFNGKFPVLIIEPNNVAFGKRGDNYTEYEDILI